jgi:hypothetical protein
VSRPGSNAGLNITTPRDRGAPAWWLARARFGGCVCFAAATVLASGVCAAGARAALIEGSSVSSFCARLPASKVSSAVGAKVVLREATVSHGALECIYFGTEEVVISMHPGLPASEVSSRTKAEQFLAGESPKGVKFTFGALSSIGPTAFSWTYVLNGGRLVGVSNNKGTTGYGVVVGGSPALITVSKELPRLEHLLSLDEAA